VILPATTPQTSERRRPFTDWLQETGGHKPKCWILHLFFLHYAVIIYCVCNSIYIILYRKKKYRNHSNHSNQRRQKQSSSLGSLAPQASHQSLSVGHMMWRRWLFIKRVVRASCSAGSAGIRWARYLRLTARIGSLQCSLLKTLFVFDHLALMPSRRGT